MRDDPVAILSQQLIGPSVYRMVLQGEHLPEYGPGQFGLLSVPDSSRLLPRPLGISSQSGDQVEVLYRVVGGGTACWPTLAPGTKLTLRGPAGNVFVPPQGPVIGVAGTLGIVPLLRWREVYGPFKALVLGVPDGRWQVFCDRVAHQVPELIVCCDDGSFGRAGNCLAPLQEFGHEELVVCGPNGMMKALAGRLSPDRRWQVSLERRMGCGFGGCHGCVVPLKSGLKRLCVDGPVMWGSEVIWDELLL